MATTSHTVVIFEGIASVDVDGVAHDTYMTIRTEAVGQTIRWFGSFGWMGKAPKGLFHGEFLDATLSDGRECQIYIPHPPDDNGQVDFLDRKSVVEGKSVSVRVDLGGRRPIKKKKKEYV